MLSRREVLTWSVAGGIALSVSRVAGAGTLAFLERETLPGKGVSSPARGRVDGIAKATGAKLYSSDFRAADLPGWPSATSYALLARAADATHLYEGLDLDRVAAAASPSVVVTAQDVERIGARVPAFHAGDLFCPIGKTPLYLGQPVALLLFEGFDAYDRARLVLRDGDCLKFGAQTGPVAGPNYGAFRFTRVAGPSPIRQMCIHLFKRAGSAQVSPKAPAVRCGSRCRWRLALTTPGVRPSARRSARK